MDALDALALVERQTPAEARKASTAPEALQWIQSPTETKPGPTQAERLAAEPEWEGEPWEPQDE